MEKVKTVKESNKSFKDIDINEKAKYFINDFIGTIQNETYNKIRNSQSDAQCRRILKELLKKYEI